MTNASLSSEKNDGFHWPLGKEGEVFKKFPSVNTFSTTHARNVHRHVTRTFQTYSKNFIGT